MGISTGIYLKDDVIEHVQGKADKFYKGNVSAYLSDLIETDIKDSNSTSGPLSPSIIIDLAKVLIGEIDAGKIERQIDGKSQPEILAKLLRSLIDTNLDLD